MELMSCVLAPFGALYRAGVSLRNEFYERGVLPTISCGCPLLSVGNITTGGTGKTPFTALLAEGLSRRGHRTAILSRGYRAQFESDVRRVVWTKNESPRSAEQGASDLATAAVLFGDEPVMLANRLPGVPVFIGRDKVRVAQAAIREVKPDVLIADDAFQHRRLHRDFDIVLLDATEPEWHFRALPGGRMREPWNSLQRAQALVFTKVNLADAERLKRLRSHAIENIRGSSNRFAGMEPLCIDLEYRLRTFLPLGAIRTAIQTGPASSNTYGASAVAPVAGERVFLFSAIGRPASFADLLRAETRVEIVGHEIFSDHHSFRAQDFVRLAQRARACGATKIVMTEKDAVKIPMTVEFPVEALVGRLEAVPCAPLDGLYARLAGILR